MKTLIVVPARYGSKRFPGKPLADLAGQSLIARVGHLAKAAAGQLDNAAYAIATDDDRIAQHCAEAGLFSMMTSEDCASGSDRALQCARAHKYRPDIVVNLQGDAPFVSISTVVAIAKACAEQDVEVATACSQLSWQELDMFRTAKQSRPFSGTSVLLDQESRAIWFSKNILPAIRNEAELRRKSDLSPVHQHIGLYAYRFTALERFASLPVSHYEALEGLEQLRLLEAGIPIQCIDVPASPAPVSGIDTPEDLAEAEAWLSGQ